jgi:hypothetical protein
VPKNGAHAIDGSWFGAIFADFILRRRAVKAKRRQGAYTDKQKRQAEHIEEGYEKIRRFKERR